MALDITGTVNCWLACCVGSRQWEEALCCCIRHIPFLLPLLLLSYFRICSQPGMIPCKLTETLQFLRKGSSDAIKGIVQRRNQKQIMQTELHATVIGRLYRTCEVVSALFLNELHWDAATVFLLITWSSHNNIRMAGGKSLSPSPQNTDSLPKQSEKQNRFLNPE